MASDYLVLAPEICILIAALLTLFGERLGGDRAAAAIGVVGAVLATTIPWFAPRPESLFGGALLFEPHPASIMVRASIAFFTAMFLAWVFARGWAGTPAREAVSMTLFAALGGMLLVSANDMVTLFLALEIATMPGYVLLGYARDERNGLEGTLKYFLLSVLTSLFLAYGLSFVYGISGATIYDAIDLSGGGRLAIFAAVLVIIGFLAKISAAPMQYWAPDAYAGATVPAVGFVSSVAKIGPLFAFVKFVSVVLHGTPGITIILLVASIASMVLGNLVALVQTDIRRLMAYSGIANAGYMLLGVAAGTAAGYASAVFFAVVYVVGVLGLMLVVAAEGPMMQDIAGLVHRRPVAAWSSIGFLFSLIGFPPMVGFYGKLTVFGSALDVGFVWPVVVAIIMSVISAGYAFAIIRAMFTPGESAPEEIIRPSIEEASAYPQMPVVAGTVILTLAILSVLLGIVTQPLVDLLRAAVGG